MPVTDDRDLCPICTEELGDAREIQLSEVSGDDQDTDFVVICRECRDAFADAN